MSNEKLETLFAIEFGQLLENYLFSNPLREEITDMICSCLQLRNRQSLAQVFAGYDTPSTANIFELIRNLNDEEFTTRFFKLQTTLPTIDVSKKVEPESNPEPSVEEPKEPVDTRPYWLLDEPNDNDMRKNDPMSDELGDMDLLKDFKFDL